MHAVQLSIDLVHKLRQAPALQVSCKLKAVWMLLLYLFRIRTDTAGVSWMIGILELN